MCSALPTLTRSLLNWGQVEEIRALVLESLFSLSPYFTLECMALGKLLTLLCFTRDDYRNNDSNSPVEITAS